MQSAQAQDAAAKAYIRSVVASPADEVAKLADLKAQGVIDDAEFERLKAKAIAGSRGRDPRAARFTRRG